MLEETARMIYEAETGRLWKDATEEERRHWLREAQHLIDAIHAPWPTHLVGRERQ
jgi:hypothetical protein